jgi:hypothetical protein
VDITPTLGAQLVVRLRNTNKGHQEKRHTNLMCDSKKKSHVETPPKSSHENPMKKLRKSPKRRNVGRQRDNR